MFLQFLINRRDARKGELAKLKEEFTSLRNEIREEQAITARVRILRFSDEMLHGDRHSKESFDQALQDIDRYNDYCDANPRFENERAKAAITHIKRVYEKCLEQNDFLK